MSIDVAIAFQKVKPICVELSRHAFLPPQHFNPSSKELLKSLHNLNKELENIANDASALSPKFADYVFVPIASLFKQESLDVPHVRELLLIISHLTSLCWSTPGSFPQSLSRQLFPLITFLISSDKHNAGLNAKGTSFQLAAAKILETVYASLAIQKRHNIYDFFSEPNNLPALGHSVTILLDILVHKGEDKEVGEAVLKALDVLYREAINDGEVLSFILPGNVSSIAKLFVKPGVTVNYKVICKSLDLLEFLLTVVYSDTDLEARNETFTIEQIVEAGHLSPITVMTANSTSAKSGKVHRDTKWLQATSAQVKLALEGVMEKLKKRNNMNIIKALANFAKAVLLNCTNSLANCRELLLTVLFDTSGDQTLSAFDGFQAAAVKSMLETDTSRIGHFIQSDDDSGMTRIKRATEYLANSNYLEDELVPKVVYAIKDGMIQFLEQKRLRMNDTKLIEQGGGIIIHQNLLALDSESFPLIPTLPNNFTLSLVSLVQLLGSVINEAQFCDVVDQILGEEETSHYLQAAISVWMGSLLMVGQSGLKRQIDPHVDEFLDFGTEGAELAGAPLGCCYSLLEECSAIITELTRNKPSLSKPSEMCVSLSLEGIKLLSESMGENFRDELIDYLFPVIDCLASTSPIIRSFARSAVQSIADNLYKGSVRDLLLDNTDYLVDAISSFLNNCVTDRVATVLMVLFQIGGYDVVQRSQDVLQTLFRLVDSYHGYTELCMDCFQLFDLILSQINSLYVVESVRQLPSSKEFKTSSFSPWGIQSMNDLMTILDRPKTEDSSVVELEDDKYEERVSGFQDYFDQKLRQADSDDEDDDDTMENGNQLMEPVQVESHDAWLSPIPLESYRLLLQIFGYGERLLMHDSKPLRAHILRSMERMAPLLETQHNSYLPQVASSWNAVVECSLSEDYTLATASFRTLRAFITTAGDFLTKRFIDLWTTYKRKSPVVRHTIEFVSTANGLSIPREFPMVIKEALISLAELLLEGICKSELHISDTLQQEMLRQCLIVLPKEHIQSKSLHLGDIAESLNYTIKSTKTI
ncbi:LAMI_0F10484g1_1 [Lachancea mirantina]|uniref:LAMI_0F10484g1_1 n=1 Tax=Lachancea mirantina TaxID=1230905 RepID=A0A1G4K1V1_9SACH|nr:LAMI_0F10484g1_1 [Lachancea mirantina]